MINFEIHNIVILQNANSYLQLLQCFLCLITAALIRINVKMVFYLMNKYKINFINLKMLT